MRRTVEVALLTSGTTSAVYTAVIFTDPCHSSSFLNALSISVIDKATYPDACSICLAKEGSKSMGLFTRFCLVEAFGATERLQDLPLVL
jgi:hypothetical protein